VSFTSTSTDLTTDANAAVKDVFVRDIATRTTRPASVRADGTTRGTTDSEISGIAANGGLVAFTFNDAGAATKLVASDANAQPDVLAKELAPSDAAGPSLTLSGPAEGATVDADQVAVGGSAADPSGIVRVTVNGTALPLTATGGFSTTVPVVAGANALTVQAVDGAGNATTVARTVTVTRSAPVTSTPRPRARARLLALRATLTKAGKVRVVVRLSAKARVRVSLLRRTVRAKPRRRIVLGNVARPVTRTLGAGRRAIVLKPRRRLARGRYVVRVRILSPAAGPKTRSRSLKVTRRR